MDPTFDADEKRPDRLRPARASADIADVRTARLPTWSRLDVATKQSALFGVGGDFFEVFQQADGCVSTVMADVCGKGPSAAIVVQAVRPVLRRCLTAGHGPGAVLTALNNWLARHDMSDTFVTAVAVRIDVATGVTQIASAGHLGPFVRRRSGRVVSLTPAGGGVPLGMLPGQWYHHVTLELGPEDAVVLVTDGITDPLATELDVLGEQGLLDRLAAAPHGTTDICHALLADDAPARDDSTVLVLQLPAHAVQVEAA
jgi:serine phosphatase RsbU (regulator of sigma subunit)